jgi:hypothetical protein
VKNFLPVLLLLTPFITHAGTRIGETCPIKITASDFQDGGFLVDGLADVTIPNVSPATGYFGHPQNCVFMVSPRGIPNARSFLQSNFAFKNDVEGADFIESISLESSNLVSNLVTVGEQANLVFRKLRFNEGGIRNSNVQELQLSVRPNFTVDSVVVAGIWVDAKGVTTTAFPEFKLNLPETLQLVWVKKWNSGAPETNLQLYVPTTGYLHTIYSSAMPRFKLPLIQPYSSTIGALSDSGLKPDQSFLRFSFGQACTLSGTPVDCF